MSPKKKLFEADDFDKKKKLFTSSDFDKESEEDRLVEHPQNGNNGATGISEGSGKSNSKNWIWIILFILIVCTLGYFIFSKDGDSAVKESEQDTELVEETILPTDSVGNQEESTEEVLPTHENEVSNNADDQNAKVNEAPATTDNNSNIATATTSVASNANVSNDVEAEAMKVIRGDYGVGQERKDKLGSKYKPIQSRVNELKRKGIF